MTSEKRLLYVLSGTWMIAGSVLRAEVEAFEREPEDTKCNFAVMCRGRRKLYHKRREGKDIFTSLPALEAHLTKMKQRELERAERTLLQLKSEVSVPIRLVPADGPPVKPTAPLIV